MQRSCWASKLATDVSRVVKKPKFLLVCTSHLSCLRNSECGSTGSRLPSLVIDEVPPVCSAVVMEGQPSGCNRPDFRAFSTSRSSPPVSRKVGSKQTVASFVVGHMVSSDHGSLYRALSKGLCAIFILSADFSKPLSIGRGWIGRKQQNTAREHLTRTRPEKPCSEIIIAIPETPPQRHVWLRQFPSSTSMLKRSPCGLSNQGTRVRRIMRTGDQPTHPV